MTASFTVLVPGYARKISENEYAASSNVILIRDSGRTILFDPGIDSSSLFESLQKEGLTVFDIDTVFLSHQHVDHTENAYLFPVARVIGDTGIPMNPQEKFIPDTQIEIISTPGHTRSHLSLIIPAEDGRTAAAGDVFWWEDGKEQAMSWEALVNIPDPFDEDMNLLKETRGKLLSMVDYVIPGHGKPFRVPSKPAQ